MISTRYFNVAVSTENKQSERWPRAQESISSADDVRPISRTSHSHCFFLTSSGSSYIAW